MPGPDPLVTGGDPPVAGHPDPGQVRGDLDPAADHRRVHGVVVAVQPHVMVTGQPRGLVPPGDRGHRRQARSSPPVPAAIRSAGAHCRCRRHRVFTVATHPASWALKSAGEANVRPGSHDRSR